MSNNESLVTLFNTGSEDEGPAQIASVWDHPLVKHISNAVEMDDGTIKMVKTWKCLAPVCETVFSGWNATKATGHGSKDDAYCIAVHVRKCRSVTSDYHTGLFRVLIQRKLELKHAKEKAAGAVLIYIDESQEEVVHAVMSRKRKGASMEPLLGFAR